MFSELVQLSFDKILQTQSYTVVVLGTLEKKFAIYTDPSIGRILQMLLTEVEKPRPLTHDLIEMIFKGINMRVLQVVINDLQDTVYFGRIFLEHDVGDMRHILEIDSRPSDCLTLALMSNAPVYCTQDVLDRTIAVEE
jgi:bifunctional DNase/RNase